MKRQIIILLVLLSLLLTTNLFAQQTGRIENGFNVGCYPEVSFTYHSFNPDILEKKDFWHLKESGVNREFNVELLPAVNDSLPQTTLILWEDMAHNGIGQFDFTQKVLSEFFKNAYIPPFDKFAVSAFNRRKNNKTSLTDLTGGFTKDKSKIISAVQGYRHSAEHYPEFPNRSDMYTAIREGMDLLAPTKGPKAIIVFTSGYSMKNSGSDSEAQVLLKAQQLHIPVYIFQYYLRSGVAPESEGFAKSTFGGFNSYKDVASAEAALTGLYPRISERYKGHDYKISFTSGAQRGTEASAIALSVCGVEVQEQFFPPVHTLGSWIAAHPWLTVLFSIIIISIISGVILFIRRTRKSEAANRRELADLEQRRLQDKEAAEQYRRNIETKAQQERETQEKQAHEEHLRRLMMLKNIFPRLKCSVGGQIISYEIDKPITSIGREQDNDLILSDDKVSRHHADIVFNGSGFEIIDKHSTNKVIVNGQFVDRTMLKSGDLIGLGEVVITFLY